MTLSVTLSFFDQRRLIGSRIVPQNWDFLVMLTEEAPNKQVVIKLASSLAEYSLANVGNVVSTGSIPAEDNILVIGVFYQRMKEEQLCCRWGARSALL